MLPCLIDLEQRKPPAVIESKGGDSANRCHDIGWGAGDAIFSVQQPRSMPLILAHLSDVHLAPLQGLGPLHANPKRTLGLANWLLKRRKIHLRPVVDALLA